MFSSFMVNTWIVATIVALVAGCVGFFVVIRGSSFAAHALPLGTFPGAAGATLLGINPLFGLVAFSILGAIGISHLSRRSRHDVAIALCLVMLLGVGALFLSMTSAYSQAVYALLFGEVLGVSNSDIAVVAVVGVIAVGATIALFRPLLISAISPDLAEARGVSVQRMEFCFLGILALATAVALPVVGAFLVFSLMIGPAAAARSLTHRPGLAAACSSAIAVAVVWTAIVLSYVTDWPIGFFVGALGILSYGVGRLAVGGPTVRLEGGPQVASRSGRN